MARGAAGTAPRPSRRPRRPSEGIDTRSCLLSSVPLLLSSERQAAFGLEQAGRPSARPPGPRRATRLEEDQCDGPDPAACSAGAPGELTETPDLGAPGLGRPHLARPPPACAPRLSPSPPSGDQ